MKKISIIIPMYNEEKNIEKIVSKVKAVNFGKIKKEIIVIDDGSKDKSLEIAKKIKGIFLLKHKKNLGKGSAIKTALKISTGDFIVVQDSDLELNPENLKSLLKPILEGKSSVVYGTRFHKTITDSNMSFFFYSGGKFVSFLTNLLYGSKLTDVPCGYKMFKKEIIKNINLKCKRFEFCPEVTAKILKKGIKIMEVPVDYAPRTIKQGKKLRYKDGIVAIWTLIKNRLS